MPGGGNSTTTQKAEPWGPSQPSLMRGLGLANTLLDQRRLAPKPFAGDRVANLTTEQRAGMSNMLDTARGQPTVDAASGSLLEMLKSSDGVYRDIGGSADQGLGTLRQDMAGFQRAGPVAGVEDRGDLEAVKRAALESAVPAAGSMFARSGMLDSGAAMDTVGRAAAEAVAPIEYGAYERNLDRDIGIDKFNANQEFGREQATLGRGMSLAQMGMDMGQRGLAFAPSIAGLEYLPAEQQMRVGAMRQGQNQAELDGRMQRYNESAEQPFNNLARFSQLAMGYGGQGSTGTMTEPGASPGSRIAGAGMTGLGAYGALSGMGAGGPVGAGLAGMLALSGLF